MSKALAGAILGLLVAGLAAQAQVVTLEPPCAQLGAAIRDAAPGTIILLPPHECALEGVTRVPSGVTVSGREGSVVRASIDDRSSRPALDLSGSENVVLRDFELRLDARVKGVAASNASGIELRSLRIHGNLGRPDVESTSNEEGDSSLAVDMIDVANVVVDHLEVTESFGGVYMRRVAGAEVTNNRFEGVNFGNLVISGEDILIEHNRFIDPGRPSANHHSAGDGITLGSGTSQIVIRDNVFEDGNCYFIHAPRGGLDDIAISGNVFRRSTTTAVFLYDSSRANIVDNQFLANEAHGIVLNRSRSATIAGNVFDDDSVYISDSSDTWVENNTFRGAGSGERAGSGWMIQGGALLSAGGVDRTGTRPPGWLGFCMVALASLATVGLLLRAGRSDFLETGSR